MKQKIILLTLITLWFHHAVYCLTEKEIVEKAKANLEKIEANIEKLDIKDLPETVKKEMVERVKKNFENMVMQDLPETVIVRAVMEINDRNEYMEREFDIFSKRYGFREAKALITFIRPSNVKILAHVDDKGKQNIWVKFTSGKIRKVSMDLDSQRSIPILSDTHFTFEDMNMDALSGLGLNFTNLQGVLKNLNVDDMENEINAQIETQMKNVDLQYIGEKMAAGSECHMIASTLKDTINIKDFPYRKVIYYFRKSDFYPVRMDFFKRKKLFKYLEVYDISAIKGYPIPFKIVMQMANANDNTTLRVKAIEFNTTISDSKFNKSSL